MESARGGNQGETLDHDGIEYTEDGRLQGKA